jgi:hypothetical protein
MTKASRGSILVVLAALALAGCGKSGSDNQANMAVAPDMASDTGMNAADTTATTDTTMMNGSDSGMNGMGSGMGNAGTSMDAGNVSGSNGGNSTGY